MLRPITFINIFLLIFLCSGLIGQEICDDGIDNDGDGLIDLNDKDDCVCEIFVPSSLIPNPSFEDRTCCPVSESELECADFWVQASRPTTDYVHTCGTLGNIYLIDGNEGTGFYEAPLPFPDGNGAIGFRDGKFSNPNFKEYAGSYLLENMKVGVDYTLDFWVGFHTEPSSRILPIAIFATDLANKLPFGNGSSTIGCPTNEVGWDQLGELVVEGNTEWVNVVFEFTPEKSYAAIVLGPGCEDHPDFINQPYFFFDNLIIAESGSFGLPFSDISGSPCNNDLVITATENNFSVQWYLDGVAILNESQQSISLDVTSPEGVYQALITTSTGCQITESYELVFPDAETFFDIQICEGETYELGSQILDTEGTFSETFTIGQCDSTAIITLAIFSDSESFHSDILCEGIDFEFGGVIFEEPGQHDVLLTNANGCDSIVHLELSEFPNIEEWNVEDSIVVNLGDDLHISVSNPSDDIDRLEWYKDELLLSEESDFVDVQPLASSVYDVIAYTDAGCWQSRSIVLEINRDIKIYTPNVITQSGSGNNRFIVGTDQTIDNINSLRIYDRWGELMYLYEGPPLEQPGWDGWFRNGLCEIGVYTYAVELGVIDGEIEKRVGTILVLR